ncbi:MAG: response regulator [bacterium]
MTQEPLLILLVEDNPGDVELTRASFERCKISNKLSVVNDGEAALDYLHRVGEYADAPRPDLILLDLNLPRKDGRTVLSEIKTDPDLRTIPVVVLTSSQAESDILSSYMLHANSYITKPVGIQDMFHIVSEIESFWFSIVKLPSKRRK